MVETAQTYSKIHIKMQWYRTAKHLWKRGLIALPDFKIYYEATNNQHSKLLEWRQTNKPTNGTESSKTDQYIKGEPVFNKDAKAFSEERIAF